MLVCGVLAGGGALVRPAAAAPQPAAHAVPATSADDIGRLADSPAQLLAYIQAASRNQDYEGVFMYQQGENTQSSRMVHVVDASGERERVETLDGQPRIYLRHNDDVQYLQPDRKIVRRDSRHTVRFPGLLQRGPAQVLGHYKLKVLDRLNREAGRECRVVLLEPRDALRYGLRLCVDTQTGLLLKEQTLDSARRIVEQVSFSSVRLGKDVDPARVDSSWDTGDWKVLQPSMKPIDLLAQGWRIAMPEGFKAILEVARQIGPASGGAPHVVSQMVLSDGLVAISLFIEPYDASRHRHPPAGPIRHGAINIYGRRVAGYWLTALGEVPIVTLERLANSARYIAKPPAGAAH
ncbi:MucB/RseB C-terminal domain-containing protein [Bordetella sp. FB-8]|uniref:MucB/RseB C-terminal domain-containing protein n=1 Tax=Bordetella sp. FB-8 TaxID=1159870 RepID=UPI00038223E9